MSTPFHLTHTREVAFGDCDPAGIVYTGKIVDFALEAIDAFWRERLNGTGWFQMNVDLGIGTPFVHLELDFAGPITPRAPLETRVRFARMGDSSVTFEVKGVQQGRACFAGRFVCVFVEKATMRKISVPDWVAGHVKGLVQAGQ